MAFDPTLPYSSVETAGGFQCNLQSGSYWSKIIPYPSVTLPSGYIDPSASPVKWGDSLGTLLIRPDGTSVLNGSVTLTNQQTIAGFVPANLTQDVITKYAASTGPNQSIVIGARRQLQYNSAQSLNGTGHTSAAIDWYIQNGLGDPGLAIALEVKGEVFSAASITSMTLLESQLSVNFGVISAYRGVDTQIIGNNGTLVNAFMFTPNVPSTMVGTIGTYIGFYQTAITINNPLGTKLTGTGLQASYSFKNDDPNLPIASSAPIIDRSVNAGSASTTGFTLAIPIRTSFYYIYLSGTAIGGAGTITIPAVTLSDDGQEITIFTRDAIATVTMSFGGKANYGNVTSLAAFQTVKFKYFDALGVWQRLA